MTRRHRVLSVETTISPCKEGGGLAFLMDSATTAPVRWGGGRRGRRLLRNCVDGLTSPEKKPDLGHLEEPLRRLSFTNKDLQEVIDDRDDFRSLQSDLRKKGAVTNSLVREGLHFYVQTCLENKRLSDSPTSLSTPKSTSSSSTGLRERASSWASLGAS